MKILIVCQYFYPETFSITDVALEFIKRGHEVLVVTGLPNYGQRRILDGYQDIEDECVHGIRIHRCKLRPRKKGRINAVRNYISFWRSSKRYLKKLDERFDVVYSMSLSPLISVVGATMYARRFGIRHVLHCLDLWPESTVVTGAIHRGSASYHLLFHWCRKIYQNLDEIMVSSPSFRSYFDNQLQVKNVPITYVPQPPVLAVPSSEIKYTHPFNFVYSGNIGTLQLIEDIVRAAALLKGKLDFQLHLIGMGTRTEAVKKLIQTLGLENEVIFHGMKSRADSAAYYKNATALIVPLKHEGTVGDTIPNKLTSYLYYGKPIVAVIEGDGRKVLDKSQSAVFSKSESPEDIAQAFMDMARLPEEKRAELGRNGEKYFHEHFDLDEIVDEILRHLSAPPAKEVVDGSTKDVIA